MSLIVVDVTPCQVVGLLLMPMLSAGTRMSQCTRDGKKRFAELFRAVRSPSRPSSQDWPPGLQRILEGHFGSKDGENVHFKLRGSAS